MASDVLRSVFEHCKAVGQRGVVAFDLDSTVFDNRPRQARIVREFGYSRDVPELTRCQPWHFAGSWDMRRAFVACGLTPEQTATLFDDARSFWKARFFTSNYCREDVAIAGAKAYLDQLKSTGVQIAYVSGRHEGMRWGTEQAMVRAAFPLPDGTLVHLVLKPTFEQHDDAWKLEAHSRVERLGRMVAAFDNEPAHANGYRARFPDAIVVRLDTDHSGRPVVLSSGIDLIRDFQAPSADPP
jgi:hypothetical protein